MTFNLLLYIKCIYKFKDSTLSLEVNQVYLIPDKIYPSSARTKI